MLRFGVVEGEKSLRVTCQGLVPDAFAQTDSVVVEDEYPPDGVFRADVLVIQCSLECEAELEQ